MDLTMLKRYLFQLVNKLNEWMFATKNKPITNDKISKKKVALFLAQERIINVSGHISPTSQFWDDSA
jgi:hypothetical protein